MSSSIGGHTLDIDMLNQPSFFEFLRGLSRWFRASEMAREFKKTNFDVVVLDTNILETAVTGYEHPAACGLAWCAITKMNFDDGAGGAELGEAVALRSLDWLSQKAITPSFQYRILEPQREELLLYRHHLLSLLMGSVEKLAESRIRKLTFERLDELRQSLRCNLTEQEKLQRFSSVYERFVRRHVARLSVDHASYEDELNSMSKALEGVIKRKGAIGKARRDIEMLVELKLAVNAGKNVVLYTCADTISDACRSVFLESENFKIADLRIAFILAYPFFAASDPFALEKFMSVLEVFLKNQHLSYIEKGAHINFDVWLDKIAYGQGDEVERLAINEPSQGFESDRKRILDHWARFSFVSALADEQFRVRSAVEIDRDESIEKLVRLTSDALYRSALIPFLSSYGDAKPERNLPAFDLSGLSTLVREFVINVRSVYIHNDRYDEACETLRNWELDFLVGWSLYAFGRYETALRIFLCNLPPEHPVGKLVCAGRPSLKEVHRHKDSEAGVEAAALCVLSLYRVSCTNLAELQNVQDYLKSRVSLGTEFSCEWLSYEIRRRWLLLYQHADLACAQGISTVTDECMRILQALPDIFPDASGYDRNYYELRLLIDYFYLRFLVWIAAFMSVERGGSVELSFNSVDSSNAGRLQKFRASSAECSSDGESVSDLPYFSEHFKRVLQSVLMMQRSVGNRQCIRARFALQSKTSGTFDAWRLSCMHRLSQICTKEGLNETRNPRA